MIKDLAKEKSKSESELPQMSQVWTVSVWRINFVVKQSVQNKPSIKLEPLFHQSHNQKVL